MVGGKPITINNKIAKQCLKLTLNLFTSDDIELK